MEGGPTIKQTFALFEHLQEIKNNELIFLAGVHGIDLTDKKKVKPQSDTSKTPFFGDTSDYADLSESEKEELTKKMMGSHKNWANGGILK